MRLDDCTSQLYECVPDCLNPLELRIERINTTEDDEHARNRVTQSRL